MLGNAFGTRDLLKPSNGDVRRLAVYPAHQTNETSVIIFDLKGVGRQRYLTPPQATSSLVSSSVEPNDAPIGMAPISNSSKETQSESTHLKQISLVGQPPLGQMPLGQMYLGHDEFKIRTPKPSLIFSMMHQSAYIQHFNSSVSVKSQPYSDLSRLREFNNFNNNMMSDSSDSDVMVDRRRKAVASFKSIGTQSDIDRVHRKDDSVQNVTRAPALTHQRSAKTADVAPDPKKSDVVLWDQNFREWSKGLPLILGLEEEQWLKDAVSDVDDIIR